MTNKSYTSMTALELIAIAATTPEAVTEMRRRMANTRNLAHANSAKVRSYNSMAKFFGEEPMVFTRKDGTELALAKSKPAMKSAKTVAKKVTKQVAKTSPLSRCTHSTHILSFRTHPSPTSRSLYFARFSLPCKET